LYSRSRYSSLPSKPGVYVFLDKNNTILYVGKALDLKSRVSSYFTTGDLGEKTRILVSLIVKIRIIIVESELEALLLEAHLIKKHLPHFNIRLTDGKSYVLVRITLSDVYPKVLLARRVVNPSDIIFGPFPNSSSVKLVLKTIRKAFPYQSVNNHPKRICLYNHLGLCPCPPVNNSLSFKKEYKKNIRSIIQIFEGKTKQIIKNIEKKRDVLSKNEQFEEALLLQKRIDALTYITQPKHVPSEYIQNPNLRSDLRKYELNELAKILKENGCDIDTIHKIECFDISNTQGTNATASMVVFIDGEKEGSLYRKFKIQRNATPDDFASMREVFKRRLKHKEWNFPDLLIVDGGKGQVSATFEVLQENNLHIPVIGLAKREETIIIPRIKNSNIEYRPSDLSFTEVSLPKDTKALLLMQRIRNEAHRFAIAYHRNLRSKAALGVNKK